MHAAINAHEKEPMFLAIPLKTDIIMIETTHGKQIVQARVPRVPNGNEHYSRSGPVPERDGAFALLRPPLLSILANEPRHAKQSVPSLVASAGSCCELFFASIDPASARREADGSAKSYS
jgi:hypothetical protein